MSRSVFLMGTAREQSTRVQNKMLRPFAGTTLFDIYLDKLDALRKSGMFSSTAVAVCPQDEALWNRAVESPVPVIARSTRSVSRGIQRRSDELHFLRDIDADYVCFLNACLPFFPAHLVLEAISIFQADPAILSLTTMREAHNWYWWPDGRPVNNTDAHCLSTQGCPPLTESVHAVNIYPRLRMVNDSQRWTFQSRKDPQLFYICEDLACMDVDTELDFEVCEGLWRARFGGKS